MSREPQLPDPGALGAAETDPAGAVARLLLADARLPAGGHAHSAVLEGAVAAGLTAAEVPEFLTARLRTVARTEAAAAVLAHRASGHDQVDLAPIITALEARTPSAPQREASRALGRGLSRLARHLAGTHPGVRALPRTAPHPPRPVALGCVAAALGVSEPDTARLSLYEDAQTVAAAALKLLPGDPVATTTWIVQAAPLIEDGVGAAVATTAPHELPARSAPLLDQWAGEHAHTTRRLFHA
ncbi:urease accessory UreF family protein [Lipingzhangella sp. LS1_29]|uniref:Urease accessory UreF family protein n=1 Tax=Lipingzhangella rawalii TaxID=2055835 RepID=A0ABU2H296_9ACTN|nr:urease accessory UreF family protein [Lipingzhangella rawalii]MDS1269428.1 urease accessory UreF family protein [Lipingzhangella rawalii]